MNRRCEELAAANQALSSDNQRMATDLGRLKNLVLELESRCDVLSRDNSNLKSLYIYINVFIYICRDAPCRSFPNPKPSSLINIQYNIQKTKSILIHLSSADALHEAESSNKDLTRQVGDLNSIRVQLEADRDSLANELADCRDALKVCLHAK